MGEAVIPDEVCALGAFAGTGAAEDVYDGNLGGGEGRCVFGRRGELGFRRWGGDGGHFFPVVVDGWLLGEGVGIFSTSFLSIVSYFGVVVVC